jgi:hypothetical protein
MMAKHVRLRQLLAETNLDIASNARAIDDVPTRSELIQYEKRFAELYQQVSWKHDETKKYFAIYNTLELSLSFLQREVLRALLGGCTTQSIHIFILYLFYIYFKLFMSLLLLL